MNFDEWFRKSWYEAKGLISPQNAGDIVNLTGTRIIQIWKHKKLTIYKYENKKALIGWNDFINWKEEYMLNPPTNGKKGKQK